jgi:hypothetical protein
MNPHEEKYNLGEHLGRVKLVLEKILTHIRGIDGHLKPIEKELQEKEFAARGAFVRRNQNMIVCLPTTFDNIMNTDEIQDILEKSTFKPSIILIDDYTESIYACLRIASLIKTQFLKSSSKRIAIINLRLSQMIQPFEAVPTLMIGNRYILDDDDWLTKLVIDLNQIGIQVFYDDSQFGGGPLVSTILRTLNLPIGSIIVELTLSHSAAKKTSCVNAILDSFSSFWM